MIWTVVLVWTVVAAVIAVAVWRLARQQRGEALLSGAYIGRHRAGLGMSTMERGRRWGAAQAWAVARQPVVPRPRSPWGTPEWVDEWAGEHDPVPSKIGAAA